MKISELRLKKKIECNIVFPAISILLLLVIVPNNIMPMNHETGKMIAHPFLTTPLPAQAGSGGSFSDSLGPLLTFSISGASYISGGPTNQSNYCAGASYDLVIPGGATIQLTATGAADPSNPGAGTSISLGTNGGQNNSVASGTGTITATLTKYINYSYNYAWIDYRGPVACTYGDLGVQFTFHVKPSLTLSVNATTVQISQPFIYYGRVFPSDATMNYSVYNGTTLIDGGSTGANNDSASGPNYEGIYSQLIPGSYTLTLYASGSTSRILLRSPPLP